MELFESLLLLVGITFLAMMSPGPDMVLLIKNGLSGCRRSGFACVAGICASISVHITLAIVGLATIISTSVHLYNTVRLAGAAYLIYVGYKSIRHAKESSLMSKDAKSPSSPKIAFSEGFWCNLLNPKFTIFLVSMFSQFITPNSAFTEKLLLGSTILIESAIVWSVFVLAVQTPFFRNTLERAQVAINRTLGGILIGLGILVAVED